MNIWANAVITQKGLALQAKLLEGTSLHITRAETGTGYTTPGLLIQQTEVTAPKQSLAFKPISYPEIGKCALTMHLNNDKVETGYTALQVGIYATDPDEGEILYFIAQAVDQNHGTVVPSAAEMPGYSAEWTFYFQYGQADEVTVMVDPAGSVSREDMEEYIEDEFVAITTAEIDMLASWSGGGADWDPGDGSGGVATLDHSMLYNRSIANQHPIEAIAGLEEALNTAEGGDLETVDVSAAWEDA